MERRSAVHTGSGDRRGRCTSSTRIISARSGANRSGANDPRDARHRAGLGEHHVEGLSLPWRLTFQRLPRFPAYYSNVMRFLYHCNVNCEPMCPP